LDPQVTDATPKNQVKWKRLLRRISGTLAATLGLLYFAAVVYEQFEGHADFWELSLIEALFWGALLFLSVRLTARAQEAGASIKRVLYLPFRNIWLSAMRATHTPASA